MIKRLFTACMALGLVWLSGCTKAIIDESPEETGNGNPITRTIRYDPDVQNIMFNHCVTCHGGNAPSAGLDLSTYNNTKASANHNLIERMNDISNPMPPSGLLSEENRAIMDKWVKDGLLE